MHKITFTKMQAEGNDFIIIDNRRGKLKKRGIEDFIRKVCKRRFSVGADGLIFIVPSRKADFKWHYYNPDGSEVEMCGNGSRCAARFAYLNKIAPAKLSFETIAGIIKAKIKGSRVKVELTKPYSLRLGFKIPINGKKYDVNFLNTGVPHVVYFSTDIDKFDVVGIGRKTRYHKLFRPSGTNANFVKILGSHSLSIRTYERGVEDETLSCGTGSVAAALIAGALSKVKSPVYIKTKGGKTLKVYFKWDGKEFSQIFLEGETKVIYKGELSKEALMD
ncbi:MAG: diaminopimelate epimerase [Nitrospirae bacterium]|nr:diaminopimelate epimerase [Nitrospirota bacterium]